MTMKEKMARCMECKTDWSCCNPEVCFGKKDECYACGETFLSMGYDHICGTCWEAVLEEERDRRNEGYTPEPEDDGQ